MRVCVRLRVCAFACVCVSVCPCVRTCACVRAHARAECVRVCVRLLNTHQTLNSPNSTSRPPRPLPNKAGRLGYADGIQVETHVRLAFEQPAALFEVTLSHSSSATSSSTAGISTEVQIDLAPLVRQIPQWPWVNSYPNVTKEFKFSSTASTLITAGTHMQ